MSFINADAVIKNGDVLMSEIYPISLCIPTNGASEFVLPVLESIFSQNVPDSCFEVVITDNGNNESFQTDLKKYTDKHKNIVYKKTEAVQFLNQVEAFKIARGNLIKFVNHRFILKKGALKHLLDVEKKYAASEPVIYFSNGCLSHYNVRRFSSFDSFVKNLLYWSSWSAGLAVWKSDFDKIKPDTEYNVLFPHTDILFHERDKSLYIIDDKIIMKELPNKGTSKGKYKIFKAFGEEYPKIIVSLYNDGDISRNTMKKVLRYNGIFLGQIYYLYKIFKRPCSYDTSGCRKYISKYYSMPLVRIYGIESFIYEKYKHIKGRTLKND